MNAGLHASRKLDLQSVDQAYFSQFKLNCTNYHGTFYLRSLYDIEITISDNVTYQSLCHLSIRACILNREAGPHRKKGGLHSDLPLRPVSRTACRKSETSRTNPLGLKGPWQLCHS